MARPEDADRLLARIRAQREAQRTNALGPLRAANRRHEADEERAIRLAADNLLDKALRRLGDGDEAAARRFVERVFALALEGAEPGEPGALAVHLFLWDALREEALEADDDAWLDRFRRVDRDLEGPASHEWIDALGALLEDGDVLDADVLDRVEDLAGGRIHREAFEDVDPAERVGVTLVLLRGLLAVVG